MGLGRGSSNLNYLAASRVLVRLSTGSCSLPGLPAFPPPRRPIGSSCLRGGGHRVKIKIRGLGLGLARKG